MTQEESQCLSVNLDISTSKKPRKQRAEELIAIVSKPLEIFFEEKLQFYLVDNKPNPIMKALFTAIAASGTIENSDMVDEMIRQVQKSISYEKNSPGVKKMLIGHPFVHRLLKDMVKAEVKAHRENGKEFKLQFSQRISKILLKHFTEAIDGRAVFIFIELVENEETKAMVLKHLKA